MSEPNYLLEYWGMIQNGEVVVGHYLRKQVRNLVRDLQDDRDRKSVV